MERHVVIVAGGKGLRMGSDLPKQFLPLAGKPVLMRTIEAFHRHDPSIAIVLVLPIDQQPFWQQLCETHHFAVPLVIADGGETRFHSVRQGLAAIRSEAPDALVAVHDGVRPLVAPTVIDACFAAAAAHRAAIPVIPVHETLRCLSASGDSRTVDRDAYRLVQTPQVFSLPLLREAYRQPYCPTFTDDASVVEALRHPITLVPGNRENIKITTPDDLLIAASLLHA